MKLKELVDIKIGLALERKKANITSTNIIEYQVLTLKSFANANCVDVLPYEMFMADAKLGEQYLTHANDVVVRLRSPNNAIFINNNNTGMVVSSLMAVITNIYPGILNSLYLAHYLNSQYVQRQLIKNIQGTAIPMIKIADLNDLEIILPPLDKQNKIIAYLEAANEEVALLQKIIDEKSKLKAEIFETLIK